MRHATARAMERLRWPKNTREVRYIFPIGKMACGAKSRDGDELNLFRAEDATALLNNVKVSKIQRSPFLGQALLDSALGQHHVERAPRFRAREWKMPECPLCCVELDWALENPYVIHAPANIFSPMDIKKLSPTEKLRAQQTTQKALCGESLLRNTPIFNRMALIQFEDRNDVPWLPTCEKCRTSVLQHFGRLSTPT